MFLFVQSTKVPRIFLQQSSSDLRLLSEATLIRKRSRLSRRLHFPNYPQNWQSCQDSAWNWRCGGGRPISERFLIKRSCRAELLCSGTHSGCHSFPFQYAVAKLELCRGLDIHLRSPGSPLRVSAIDWMLIYSFPRTHERLQAPRCSSSRISRHYEGEKGKRDGWPSAWTGWGQSMHSAITALIHPCYLSR